MVDERILKAEFVVQLKCPGCGLMMIQWERNYDDDGYGVTCDSRNCEYSGKTFRFRAPTVELICEVA